MNLLDDNQLAHAKSQAGQIYRYMMQGGRITDIEALERFGCRRLAARISDIKKTGVWVKDEWRTLGNGKRIKEYRVNS